jgi:hypothetical protein
MARYRIIKLDGVERYKVQRQWLGILWLTERHRVPGKFPHVHETDRTFTSLEAAERWIADHGSAAARRAPRLPRWKPVGPFYTVVDVGASGTAVLRTTLR